MIKGTYTGVSTTWIDDQHKNKLARMHYRDNAGIAREVTVDETNAKITWDDGTPAKLGEVAAPTGVAFSGHPAVQVVFER